MSHVFVIAEAGVNHNGRLELAMDLADAARAAGADAVKFQTFRAEDVVTPEAAAAKYQQANTGATNQFDMIKQLELSDEAHRQLAAHCARVGIEFFSTPFSESAVDFLVGLGVRRIKLPSGEITNRALLEKAARTRLPLLLSTGMATLEEVQRAVGWITSQWAEHGPPEGPGQSLVLLHCTSSYPAPDEALNLRAVRTMAKALPYSVGYSDHSRGKEAALGAIALGAVVIEKHLTLDKGMPGPDHLASADPAEFTDMVASIRRLESMLGDGVKRPHAIEEDTRNVARRSLVAVRDLPAGHLLTAGDLAARRPGTGIPPFELASVVGRTLRRPLSQHTPLHWDALERL